MANTPKRTVRVPDYIWDPAQRMAHRMGMNMSQVIRGVLWVWTMGGDRKKKGKQVSDS
jgi:antitoxin component of RelBE/YafQ-DinJ toxin-antitoxin module